jgi:hypothetical protein
MSQNQITIVGVFVEELACSYFKENKVKKLERGALALRSASHMERGLR